MLTDTVKSFKIKSDPKNVGVVEKFVEDLRQEFNIGDDTYGNILITLTEAANNAIIHGNKCDLSKEVEIIYGADERGKNLTVIMKDEGPGFDYNNLPDPTDPENLEKTSGRGVFLIMQLADMVVFSDNGATVEMQFRI
jgi:serine/threonine-protein kinase RsbW